jgi:hypothetical protein
VADHDAWRWLAGRPMHRRLLAVTEGAALVLDVVRGSGRHRIATRLHLHPERPRAVDATALGATARRLGAPLRERFGQTREMTRLEVESQAALPWVGGWWIAGPGPEPTLEVREGRLEVRRGAQPIARWEPGDPTDPRAVELHPLADGLVDS